MTDLSAAVQAARDEVWERAVAHRYCAEPWPSWEAALDRYGLLVGLQRARESVERIPCMEAYIRESSTCLELEEAIKEQYPDGVLAEDVWCDRCRELRALDAEIEQARRP